MLSQICFLRRTIVYIPTLSQIENGPHWISEPIALVSVSETAPLKQAFESTIARGNPLIKPPPRYHEKEPLLAKAAGLKTWSTFLRGASCWEIYEHDGMYRIMKGMRRRGGWVPDTQNVIKLRPGSTIGDLCDRMIAILQAYAGLADPAPDGAGPAIGPTRIVGKIPKNWNVLRGETAISDIK